MSKEGVNGFKSRAWQQCRHLWVERTWKRDGSTNVMALDVALANIVYHCEDLSMQAAFELLCRGARIETKRAIYALKQD